MTQRNKRLLCALWLLSSAGIAGLVTAVAYKPQPQTIIIQKTKPAHNVNRLLKTDKWVKPSIIPTPAPTPAFKARKFWYA